MQVFTRLLIPVVVCSMSLTAAAAEKYALLIGVTKYEHARMNASPLKYPEDDAKAVADLLKQGGYTVKVLLGKDATKAEIEAALKTFSKEGNADGVVLIGMFGHGVQYDELAYFGPYDTATRALKDFKGNTLRDKNGQLLQEPDPDTMVSMREILDAMTLSRAKNKIMLADCCREDTSQARGRNAFGSNLTTADLPEGTAALFACSRNEQAYEHDDWKHGAFTRAFLDQVVPIAAQGNVKAGNLAEKIQETVEAMVQEKARKSQNVTYLNSGIVDLQLRLPKSLTVEADAPMRTASEKTAPKSPPISTRSDLMTSSVGMKLKLIPAGSFMMGSDHSMARGDEKPAHRVQISKPFYAGIHEVTIGQTLAWLNSPGVVFRDEWIDLSDSDCPVRRSGNGFERNSSTKFATSDDQPMQNISWFGAVAFCDWCSQRDPKFKYRLPTEAEWEYMARAGSMTEFPWGNSVNAFDANIDGSHPFGSDTQGPYKALTTKVGSYDPNGWDLFDTVGNIREWCSDFYEESSDRNSGNTIPTEHKSELSRVLRGGSWIANGVDARSARRDHESPHNRNHTTGFRVICE
jgi:sulfatase modifying factor 1